MRYLERAEQALEAWFLLYGLQPELDQFHLLASGLKELPPVESWRQHSRLCADGAPLEFCYGLGARPVGPGFTIDAGPYGAGQEQRLEHALKLARQAAESLSCDSRMLVDLADCCKNRRGDLRSLAIWLGMAYGREGGRSSHVVPRLKLYLSNGRREAAMGLKRALETLAALGPAPHNSASSILGALREAGYFRQLALTLEPGGNIQTKLYFRMARVDKALLSRLSSLAGVPEESFTRYVKAFLGEGKDWHDPEAGIGLALDREGESAGLVLYHCLRYYFPDDAAVRQRVLETGPAFGWDTAHYRAASRLLEGNTTARSCWLAGYGVARGGLDGLRLYCGTGSLLN